MKTLYSIALLPLLLVSCAKDTSQKTAAAPSHRSLNQRMTESNGYKQDAKGNWVPQNDRRSEFESKGESNYAKKDFKNVLLIERVIFFLHLAFVSNKDKKFT